MEQLKLKHIKQRRLLNKSASISAIVTLFVLFIGCNSNGIYYEYLKNPPLFTDISDADSQNIQYIMQQTGTWTRTIAQKQINDTIIRCYYSSESSYLTQNLQEAQQGYITAIKSIKNGKRDGAWIYLNGFGDTIDIYYFNHDGLDSISTRFNGL